LAESTAAPFGSTKKICDRTVPRCTALPRDVNRSMRLAQQFCAMPHQGRAL
jgi:hypothetical protein